MHYVILSSENWKSLSQQGEAILKNGQIESSMND